MNNSTQIKFLIGVGGILLASTAYALVKSQSLKKELSTTTQQCDIKASALLNQEYPSNTRLRVTTTHIKTQADQDTKLQTTQKPQVSVKQEKPNLKDQPKLQRFSESLEDIIKRKYRFLFSKLELSPEQQQELMHLLTEREQVALQLKDAKAFGDELGLSGSDIADLQYQIEQLDSSIAQLLGEQEERYTLLKDSDKEQEEFGQYSLGISGLFPLDTNQQEHILFSKLRHKQNFDAALETLGLNMDYPLNQDQREQMLNKIDQHADLYMEEFLKAVKPHVDHSNFPMDQYTLLENYTKTEFQQLKEQLKEQVNERGSY